MARHRVHRTGGAVPRTELERRVLEEINELEAADVLALKAKWKALLKREPPRFAKRGFLTQVLAWEIQTRAFGGLKPSLHRQLLALGAPARDTVGKTIEPTAKLRPGIKLVRSWRGVTHEVMVTDKGYLWRGQSFDSLSSIACEITGTRWSGPLFFGLKKRAASAAVKASDG
jgi:hypothetical protein